MTVTAIIFLVAGNVKVLYSIFGPWGPLAVLTDLPLVQGEPGFLYVAVGLLCWKFRHKTPGATG